MGSEIGEPRIRGRMWNWERAWGHREKHRIRRKSTGSWEETWTLRQTQGRWAGASEGIGSAFPASYGVIVQVPTNAPKDHAEDEQDSKEEQSHEDGLGHWGDQDLHGPAEGVLRGPEGGTVTRAVQAATCTHGETP